MKIFDVENSQSNIWANANNWNEWNNKTSFKSMYSTNKRDLLTSLVGRFWLVLSLDRCKKLVEDLALVCLCFWAILNALLVGCRGGMLVVWSGKELESGARSSDCEDVKVLVFMIPLSMDGPWEFTIDKAGRGDCVCIGVDVDCDGVVGILLVVCGGHMVMSYSWSFRGYPRKVWSVLTSWWLLGLLRLVAWLSNAVSFYK